MTEISKRAKKGAKFTEKYGVEAATIYKSDPDAPNLRIPPPGHVLHDPSAPTAFSENMVREMDESTKNLTVTSAVEVWTDPDTGTLWVVDGRDRLLTAREVNKRRRAEKRELIAVQLVPFPGTEKEAVARIAVKNNLRRGPTVSSQGIYVRMLRDQGWPWESIAQKLNVSVDHPEKWCRLRLPLAFCEKEVRDVYDAGEFQLATAAQFGGTAPDGSKALGKKAQLELLQEKRSTREEAKSTPKVKKVTPGVRKRVAAALLNGETENLCRKDADAAKAIAAALIYADTGDLKALGEWPDVMKIVRKVAIKDKSQ